MMYHLFFYLIWKVVKKRKTFFSESGVGYNLSRSVLPQVYKLQTEQLEAFALWAVFQQTANQMMCL